MVRYPTSAFPVNPMLESEEVPAVSADLAAGLTHVNHNALAHFAFAVPTTTVLTWP